MDILPFLHQKLVFTPADIEQVLGNIRSVNTLLMRYQRQGYVSKVRRGLYCVTNIATKQPEANKFQIASSITPTSYVAYHAAMEYHGLAHQIYYNVVVGSEQAFNQFEFDGIFYTCHNIPIFIGIDTPFTDKHVRVTNVERTIVDCIDRIDLCGGWEELINCLRSVQYVRENQLTAILQTYHKTALYKKVGFLFEQLQLPVSQEFLNVCRTYAKDSVTYLTSEGSSDTFNAAWRLYAPHNLLTINEQNNKEECVL